MIAALLITLREVIEASLIVATILGLMTKLGQKRDVKSVIWAILTAAVASFLLIAGGSLTGLKVQELYSGDTKAVIEGSLMILSAVFITWAVFFLHNYFGSYKTKLLLKIRSSVEEAEQYGLFFLTFTAVFREGLEISLFLLTIYFSSSPESIITGFTLGFILAILVSIGLFTATLRLPVFYTFRVTSILLVLFAGGLLTRGISEFVELGFLPELGRVSLFFLPSGTTFLGDLTKAVFGLSRTMNYLQLVVYSIYITVMGRRILLVKKR